MVKKVIIRIIIIIAIVLASITGYFLIIDRQSNMPGNIEETVETQTEHFMGRKIFKIIPKQDNSKSILTSNKVILYFHGGSYTAEMTNNHWNFLAKLADDTNMTIIIPDYPLTPKSTYENVFNMIEPYYKKTIADYGAENVIVMGDSAGGGMALALVEKMSINEIKQPAKTILISPWLDISMSNPNIDNISDTKLNKNALYLAGFAYSRGIKQNEEYLVSPVKGQLNRLQNVTIYIGSNDMLNPDCYLLQERAKQVGVNIEIKEYKNADHIWIIDNNDELSNTSYMDLVNTIINN